MDSKHLLARFYKTANKKITKLELENQMLKEKLTKVKKENFHIKLEKNKVIGELSEKISELEIIIKKLKSNEIILTSEEHEVTQGTKEIQNIIESKNNVKSKKNPNRKWEILLLILLFVLLVLQIIIFL
ncbi:MAG: hypothetical protein ACK5HR_03845 [Mycoplasmatales bacterium]